MTDLKEWIDNRGIKGEEYLGNLCKEKHNYLDTGKSVRCKPTDRPNGKCVCCRKRQRDESYKKNPEKKKIYYKQNEEQIKEYRKEKYRLNMLDPVFRQNRIEYKRKQRRAKGCESLENIRLWKAIKNAGALSEFEKTLARLRTNRTYDGKKYQKYKYRNDLEYNLYVKLKRGMQKAKDRGLVYEKIEVKEIINKIYSYNQCCAYCDTRLNLLIANKDNSLEMDHIVPFSNGGSHTFDNLITSCKKCNNSKKANELENWYKQQIFFKKEILEKIKQ